jgi:DNA-binding GntR family transcriptional regulator
MSSAGSLTAETFERLRTDIIHGRIRPNTRLIAADIAETLEISRTPVREALQLLASEGLVVPAKRGYMVREHTVDEVREIYEVRAALESMAARLVAERATREQLEAIEAIGAHRRSAARDSRATLVELNATFHGAIVDAAGNRRLASINQRNSEHFFNHRIAELYTQEEASVAVDGHARIMRAIKKHDGEAAAAAARDHVLEALDATLAKLSLFR